MGNKQENTIRKIKIEPELDKKLRNIFFRFDLDGSGRIEKDEIMTKFANAPQEGAQVSRLFAQMDKDKDGGIDIEEFMQFWRGVRAQNKSVESITE